MAKEGNILINFLNDFIDIFISNRRLIVYFSVILSYSSLHSNIRSFYFVIRNKFYKISVNKKIHVAIYSLTLCILVQKVSQVYMARSIFSNTGFHLSSAESRFGEWERSKIPVKSMF